MFPAVFAVFTGNYQRRERSVPQESSIVIGMTIEKQRDSRRRRQLPSAPQRHAKHAMQMGQL
jgi:hypothetical protein